ncbi:MAG TPA: sensor histidine kinase [Chloroflexota bacterium]|nr:sensor histidine kinase [Chloroflexota bacterium]
MIGQPAARAVDLADTSEPGYLAGPPLYWRLLAANLFVVLGGAVVGTALTRQFVLSGSFNLVTGALMVVVAMSLSAILTGVILHIAFRPLRELRQAIEQSPAAEPTPVALLGASPDRFGDPDILAVSQAVRGLWDRLDQHVRLLEESNRRLEEQRRELAEKTVQLQRLAGLVLAAQEDERRRVARELHDDTMQSMAALLMGLEGVQQALPEGQPQTQAARHSVLRLRDLATRMLDEMRHLALDLRPAVLDDHGLVAAVRWLAATLTERTGLPCRVTVSGDLPPEQRLPPATETALFRITQEALANVAKHAQATQCRVRLERTASAISVTVEDNGAGLPLAPETGTQEAPVGARQMGLFNMRERAALLGGTCAIRRRGVSGGTVVRAELPLLSLPAESAAAVHSESESESESERER